MRAQLYYHLTWTTRDRASTIDLPIARFLARYLPAVAHQERAHILELGVVATHVHVVVVVSPVANIPRLVQRLKGGSSAIARKEGHCAPHSRFAWAKGYSIETVSPRALDRVRAYVREQATRHPQHAIAGLPKWTREDRWVVIE